MSLIRSVDPVNPAVTLAEAKAHLRVDFADDDDYITALVGAAITHAENFTQRALVDQTWEQKCDGFPRELPLARVPAKAVTSIQYKDSAGATQTVDASVYVVDTSSEPGRVALANGQSWPTTLNEIDAVTLTYTAGYGADETTVPPGLKQAVLMHVAQLYENREPVVVGTITALVPFGYQAIIMPFMARRF